MVASAEITWLFNDFSTTINLEDSLPGSGFIDVFVRYVAARMPSDRRRHEPVTFARALGLMRQGDPVCRPALQVPPERARVRNHLELARQRGELKALMRRMRCPPVRRCVGCIGSCAAGALTVGTGGVTVNAVADTDRHPQDQPSKRGRRCHDRSP